MNAFFKRCPFEITSYIMQYTYIPQNKILLNDIVNFTEKKQELYKLFLDYWILHNEPEEYINWLSNDITLYTNNFRHTGELYGGGYTDIFYDRFFRNPFLKSKENVKKYIDYAAKHGFDGVLVEGWNEGWEDWFGNWKENVFDFVTPYSDYNIEELTAYAKAKGVKIIMHHETSGAATNYERHFDKAYKFMQEHNMNTVKTGYVGRIIPRGEHHDSQWMVNHYQRVAEKAAEYKIMVEAHEPVHPTGLHRTYPNWLANEAARGNEFNNAPNLGLVPEHETILPFTRLMGGPMDYTPGFFHFQLNQYDATRTTRVKTTLAKQLALYVTMYSPLQMAGDFPENFDKYLDAFQFIKDVPVDWDDTKVLEAEPADFISTVRKQKGKENWFLGAITDENARKTTIKLDFLEENISYEATIYQDADDADWKTKPDAYKIEKKIVTKKDVLNLSLAKGGGCAISLMKL